MLLVCLNYDKYKYLADKYPDNVNIVCIDDYKITNGVPDTNYPINFLEELKLSESLFSVTIIDFQMDILSFLDAIKLKFYVVYNLEEDDKSTIQTINRIQTSKVELDSNLTLEHFLSEKFDWILLGQVNSNNLLNSEQNVEQDSIDEEQNKLEELTKEPSENEEGNDTQLDIVQQNILPENKNKLTLEQLVSSDVDITDADVRDLKATQNKLKVGMLLQAKSMLNRVLKLSTILDKLYDKLLERIDDSIETSDTASLMYTAEYINKALSDTNNFMMSLINNEKIQNFFVIDNSTVINTVSDDRVSIDSRERVRKAAEIVLDNIDYFASGQFSSLKNPNAIDVTPEEGDSDGSTKS